MKQSAGARGAERPAPFPRQAGAGSRRRNSHCGSTRAVKGRLGGRAGPVFIYFSVVRARL
jgi:hypothetical protein